METPDQRNNQVLEYRTSSVTVPSRLWRLVRPIILIAVLCLFALGVKLTGDFGGIWWYVLFGVIGSILLLPLRLYFKLKYNTNADYRKIEFDDIPPYLQSQILNTSSKFESIGFGLDGYIISDGVTKGASTIYSIWTHRDSATRCSMAIVVQKLIAPVARTGFSTEFPNEVFAMTSNIKVPGLFSAHPKEMLIELPQIKDILELSRIHSLRVNALRSTLGNPILVNDDDPFARVDSANKRLFERQQEMGVYRAPTTPGVYRPTFVGALLLAWRCHPLAIPFRRWIHVNRTNRELHRLGFK